MFAHPTAQHHPHQKAVLLHPFLLRQGNTAPVQTLRHWGSGAAVHRGDGEMLALGKTLLLHKTRSCKTSVDRACVQV